MRITFPNLARPKRAAKRLHALAAGIPLSLCQQAIATACGYRDWHDLESQGLGDASPLDQELSLAELGDRCVFQSEHIAETLMIYYGDAKWALPRLRLSGDWAWDEYLLKALPRARSGLLVPSRDEFATSPFLLNGFSFNDIISLKREGPQSRRWDGAPDRLHGAFPFPEEARAYITKVVTDFEAEEEVPVLQAAWRLVSDESIIITLQYGYIEQGRIVESDPSRFGPVPIDKLPWRPNPTMAIVPAKLSASHFADRPRVAALIEW